MTTTVKHTKTLGVWKLGEGLWWRDSNGVHGLVQTKETNDSQKGPRGATKPKVRGVITELHAASVEEVNELLAELGFGPLDLTEDEIKWH